MEWKPEAVPVSSEGTNIDVWWKTIDGIQTFCEVKLSEADFGKASNDAHHHEKLRDIYHGVLRDHLDPSRLAAKPFFGAYQFNRNVWHMVRKEKSRLVFLLPRSNTALWNQLQSLLQGVVPATRRRISAVAIEDVIAHLTNDVQCSMQLRNYASS